MMSLRISLFADQERAAWRPEMDDPMGGLVEHADFETRAPALIPLYCVLASQVFEQIQQRPLSQDYLASCGQIIPASLIQAAV